MARGSGRGCWRTSDWSSGLRLCLLVVSSMDLKSFILGLVVGFLLPYCDQKLLNILKTLFKK
ncbi:putative bacteriocin [Streptococcus equi subsp. zooepidemicus]|uniref:Putative bacteriocin n=1 Tax=Streptococcus equi subsp. zooepidemicus (strain H70) TaxID=553483 RepID=C0MFS3_STRS7|nr:putative bacteriocin [Streptococcus equi subsp. zooepidemicus]